MKKLPFLINWLFWLCVLMLFTFTSSYYVFIMWQLYLNQEIYIYETERFMNTLELGVAVFIILVLLSAFVVHFTALVSGVKK